MREIKFRAWEKGVRQMKYCLVLGGPCFSENDLFVILQYIEAKDRNGKEIYEGDIFTMTYGGYPQKWQVGEISPYGVTFIRLTIPPLASPYHYRELRHKEEIEVIGNIYENPEMQEV